ncbi:MAG: sigma-70 family RNA polymerase sigma factor [Ktedonobacteraceae bacterium]
MSSDDDAFVAIQHIHELLAKNVDHYFPDMFRAFEKDVRSHVAHKLGSARSNEAIDDCVMRTFEGAYFSLKRKSSEDILRLENFKGWLLTIAGHVVLRWHEKNRQHIITTLPKTRARLKIYVETIELEMSESGEQRLDVPDPEGQNQPEKALEQKEARTELREFVDMLPEQYRIAVQLHYFDELKLEQIANQRQQALSAVKAHVYRGIRMLHDYFVVVQALDEMKETVRAYIEMIPTSCGIVMRLHFLEGMKLHNVAVRCKYSDDKVKRNLYHGAHIVATQLHTKNERGK